MNPVMAVVGLLKTGGEIVAGALNSRHERKMARQSLKAKAEMAAQGHAHEINLEGKEWEQLKAAAEGGTWKDEYALLTGTSFIWMLMAGSLYMAFTGDDRLLQGTVAGIQALQNLGLPVGFVIEVSIFVGLGVQAWRRF